MKNITTAIAAIALASTAHAGVSVSAGWTNDKVLDTEGVTLEVTNQYDNNVRVSATAFGKTDSGDTDLLAYGVHVGQEVSINEYLSVVPSLGVDYYKGYEATISPGIGFEVSPKGQQLGAFVKTKYVVALDSNNDFEDENFVTTAGLTYRF